ncbi:MAG: hypothetical protein R6T87_03690, partial [Marinobacter sp.]
MLWIVLGLGIAAGVVLYLAFAQPATEQQKQRRREELLGESQKQQRSAVSEELSASFYDRILEPLLARGNEALANAAPEGMIKVVRQKLQSAGNPLNITEPVFLLMRGLGALAGAGSSYIVFQSLESQQPLMRITVSLFVLAALSLAPDYWLSNKINARKKAIRRALPDLLDLLVVCTEAGMGVDGALAEVV